MLLDCRSFQDGLNGLWTDKEMSVEAVIDEAPGVLRDTTASLNATGFLVITLGSFKGFYKGYYKSLG